jgi:hypothetical protein
MLVDYLIKYLAIITFLSIFYRNFVTINAKNAGVDIFGSTLVQDRTRCGLLRLRFFTFL